VLGFAEILEAMTAQIGDDQATGPEETRSRCGGQHLAAMGNPQEACHPIERRSEVVTAALLGLSRVEGHPDTDPGLVPLGTLQSLLGLRRRVGSVQGPCERR
jgi:hypothetical protein